MRDKAGQVGEATESMLEPKPEVPEVLGEETAPRAGEIAPNYRYWREHGAGWAVEYDSRKKDQVYYHIQEIMLTEYVRHHAPAKVLEFGCGPGRHLRNLSRLPAIEAFGYDQSATMVSGARGWASQEWIDSHITIGLPTGRLPFADKQFDLVYTAEVLVHVRPEDLEGVLRELMRVSRRQVFHLETSPQYQLVGNEHDGCWWHDLVAAYGRIGMACELMASGYSTHAPYRVILDETAKTWEWSPVFLDLCRRMERDISYTMDIMRGSLFGEKESRSREAAATAAADARAGELEQARAMTAANLARARVELAESQQRVQELTAQTAQARVEAASMMGWAQNESAARADLGVAVRSLEARLLEAHGRVTSLERQINEQGQREADFLRAVDRNVWR